MRRACARACWRPGPASCLPDTSRPAKGTLDAAGSGGMQQPWAPRGGAGGLRRRGLPVLPGLTYLPGLLLWPKERGPAIVRGGNCPSPGRTAEGPRSQDGLWFISKSLESPGLKKPTKIHWDSS